MRRRKSALSVWLIALMVSALVLELIAFNKSNFCWEVSPLSS